MGVSKKAVSRLSHYRSALTRFQGYGAVKIYSCDIADTLGYTAAQVRKDFSMFGFSGKKKVGYDVAQLIKNIDRLLRKDLSITAVVCGTGNHGSALFLEQLMAAPGISITAVFSDQLSAPAAGPGLLLLPLEKLVGYVKENDIRFGIITSPEKEAQRMLDLLVLAGIQGVLNLSGAGVKVPRRCIVSTVSVVREFENLVYFVNNPNEKGTR
jgi:redox-sensing transcriptional repressor